MELMDNFNMSNKLRCVDTVCEMVTHLFYFIYS